MYKIELNNNPHDFEKQNLVSLKNGSDRLKCKNCGIEGLTMYLTILKVKGSYSQNKVENCIYKKSDLEALRKDKKIRITFCQAQGSAFENLIPDSEHIVIGAPKGQKENTMGVWVMGIGEPVKVLNNEFEYVD